MAVILVRSSLGLDGIWIAILVSHMIAALIAGVFQYVVTQKYQILKVGEQ